MGVQTDALPLFRRVQLAVVAHIRHMYTNYEHLLKEVPWQAARALVESKTLTKVAEWRGEDDEDPDAIEDTLREIIVISEDEDDEMDDLKADNSNPDTRAAPAEAGRGSVEVIHETTVQPLQLHPIDYSHPDEDTLAATPSSEDEGRYNFIGHGQYSIGTRDPEKARREAERRLQAWNEARDLRRRQSPQSKETSGLRNHHEVAYRERSPPTTQQHYQRPLHEADPAQHKHPRSRALEPRGDNGYSVHKRPRNVTDAQFISSKVGRFVTASDESTILHFFEGPTLANNTHPQSDTQMTSPQSGPSLYQLDSTNLMRQAVSRPTNASYVAYGQQQILDDRHPAVNVNPHEPYRSSHNPQREYIMPSIEDGRASQQTRPAPRRSENEVVLLSPGSGDRGTFRQGALEGQKLIRQAASPGAPLPFRHSYEQSARVGDARTLTAWHPMPSAAAVRPLNEGDYARAMAPLSPVPYLQRSNDRVAYDRDMPSGWASRQHVMREVRPNILGESVPDHAPRDRGRIVPISYSTLPSSDTHSSRGREPYGRPVHRTEEMHAGRPIKVIAVEDSRKRLPGSGPAGNDRFFARTVAAPYSPTDYEASDPSTRPSDRYEPTTRPQQSHQHVHSHVSVEQSSNQQRAFVVQPQYYPVEHHRRDRYLQEYQSPRHAPESFPYDSSSTGRAAGEVAHTSTRVLDGNQRRLQGRESGTDIIVID